MAFVNSSSLSKSSAETTLLIIGLALMLSKYSSESATICIAAFVSFVFLIFLAIFEIIGPPIIPAAKLTVAAPSPNFLYNDIFFCNCLLL